MRAIPFLLSSLTLASCITGPRNDGRNIAEQLNGENYEFSGHVMGVPVAERKPIERRISGVVFCGDGPSKILSRHALVAIQTSTGKIKEVYSDQSGAYTLAIDPQGSYELIAKSSCGVAKRSLSSEEKRGSPHFDFYLK